MERERGVTTAPCFECGKQLPTTERPDGSRAAIGCNCQGREEAGGDEQTPLLPPPVIREHGLIENDGDDDQEEDDHDGDE